MADKAEELARERREFEKWAKTSRILKTQGDALRRDDLLSDNYYWGIVQSSWEAWQASAALLRPHLESERWQTMETAPRDGTRILVDFGRVGVHAVAWEEWPATNLPIWCVDDRKHGPYALRGYVETDVKGWRPLPAPPEEEMTR